MTKWFKRLVVFVWAAAAATSAQAQTYPTKPVRIVVPLPAGGAADAIARAVSHQLGEMWGQQVVIENKGGAGHPRIRVAGRQRRARRPYADGGGEPEPIVINPNIYPKEKLTYDVEKDPDPDHRARAHPLTR